MSKANTTTIRSYEAHIQDYIDGTPQEAGADVKAWIDATLDGLATDANIIEIGSAFGRDANYMEGLGYSVLRTDATLGFVELLKNQGYAAREFNLITDEFEAAYELVFADAVLLHFTRRELEKAVIKIYNALTPGGRLSFSLKQGQGTAWSYDKLGAPRFFCYWETQEIKDLVESAGYVNVNVGLSSAGMEYDNINKWLHIIATK